MYVVFISFVDSFVIMFIDDVLVYSNDKEEHENHLPIILGFLKEKQLYTKCSKYEFWLSLVSFFRHKVSKEGVEVDLQKVEAVKN